MLRNRFLSMLTFCVVAVAFSASRAEASIQVTFTANGGNSTVVDGDANDLSGVLGEIITTQTVNGVKFNVSVASSNTPGGPVLPIVSASVNDVTGSVTGGIPLSIYVSSNNFEFPQTPPPIAISTTAGVTNFADSAAGIFTVSSYIDTANNLSASAAGTLTGFDSGSIVANTSSFALNDTSTLGSVTTPYAVNWLLAADFGASTETVNFQAIGGATLSNVPEPASLAIWSLIAVGGAAVAMRRRRQRARWSDQNRLAIRGIIHAK